MNGLVVVAVVGSLVMGVGAWLIVRPVLGSRVPWPALVGTVLAVLVTTIVGAIADVGTVEYLVQQSVATLPIIIVLLATADGSGADALARWALVLVWAGVIFPAAIIVPGVLGPSCDASECSIEDFGGALGLLVSSGSLVLLAWLPAGVSTRRELDPHTWRSIGGPVLLIWLGFAAWLVSINGAVDEYSARILIAATLTPAAGAVGWLLVDVLRGSGAHPGRSLAFGLLAGMVAIVPGAVSLLFPWSIVVGLLAGSVACAVHGSRGARSAGVATRWAITLLVATAIGYFAPPVSGDTVGFLFSGRIGGLVAPAAAFVGVALLSMVISAPLWVLLRRHASRRQQWAIPDSN